MSAADRRKLLSEIALYILEEVSARGAGPGLSICAHIGRWSSGRARTSRATCLKGSPTEDI
jgi:hypothetical protein